MPLAGESLAVVAELRRRLVKILARIQRGAHPLVVGIKLLFGVFLSLGAALYAALGSPLFDALLYHMIRDDHDVRALLSAVSAEPGTRLVEFLARFVRCVHPLKVGIELILDVFVCFVPPFHAPLHAPLYTPLQTPLLAPLLHPPLYHVIRDNHDVMASLYHGR